MNIKGIVRTSAQVIKGAIKTPMNAGHDDRVVIDTVSFKSWHNGTTDGSLVEIPHKLGCEPNYVALYANDIDAIKSATLPDKVTAVIHQADRVRNPKTLEYFVGTYLRMADGNSIYGAMEGNQKLIAKWDDKKVYINSTATAYAFPPESVTTFTMICAK